MLTQQTLEKLYTMKLNGMADAFRQQQEDTDIASLSFEERFPFDGNPDRAHAVCALLLPIGRDLIEGPTPLHTFEKPTPGTGASLLVQLLCYLACGSVPAAMTPPQDEAEWRRTLFP